MIRIGGAAFVFTILVVACSPPRESACVPGESRGCTCSSGEMGAQTCSSDGMRFDECVCTSETVDGGVPLVCGDTVCSATESAATCPSDCPAACGDGACTHDETAECESDCRAMCGDGLCTHTESPSSCRADCDPVCGDSVCSDAGESCDSCSVDCGACLPASADVFVVGALIRPWDAGNLEWDGSDAVSALLRSDILSLLARAGGTTASIVADIGARVAEEGLGLTVAPDVYGVARLSVDGVDHPELDVTLNPSEEDAYEVEFLDAGGWTLPGSAALRVTVSLYDRDVAFDDPIGTVRLDEEDLRQAWNEDPDNFHWIQVSDQMTPILFIRVLVRESRP